MICINFWYFNNKSLSTILAYIYIVYLPNRHKKRIFTSFITQKKIQYSRNFFCCKKKKIVTLNVKLGFLLLLGSKMTNARAMLIKVI